MSTLSAPPAAPLPAGHAANVSLSQQLLSFRDSALLLAYRISGNIADAEDILQNAYLKAVRTSTMPRNGTELRSWFLQLTANAAKDWCRSEHRRREREKTAAVEQPLKYSPAASEESEHNELKRLVCDEVAQLDEKFRVPICLHYEQGLTYEEASEIVGVPASSLRVNASRGVQLLRERLDRPQRPVSAETLIAVLAIGTVLRASPALAAKIEQTLSGAKTAASAATSQSANGGLKVFASNSGARWDSALLAKVLAASVAFLIGTALTLGFMLFWNRPQDQTDQQSQPAIVAEIPVVIEGTMPVAQPLAVSNRPIVVAPILNHAADYVAPPELDAQWQNAVDLISTYRPERDAVLGAWSLAGNELRLGPSLFGRTSFNYIPPEEYDFRVDFTRSGDETEMTQLIPLDGFTRAWYLDSVKTMPGPLKNGQHLQNGARHTSIVEIRKDSVTAWLDGNVIRRMERADVLDCQRYFRLPDRRMLGVGAKLAGTTFHRVLVREVTGHGEVPADDPFRAAFDENYWAAARDLKTNGVPHGARIAGRWVLKNGALTSSGKYSRYQFNYAPPEEYDMRIVFTRDAGAREIVQILAAGGKQFAWKTDNGWVSTLDLIDGKSRENGPVGLATPYLIQNGKTHTSLVCVRKDEVRAYVDGHLLLAWKTDYSDLSLEEKWALPAKEALGIGSDDSTVSFTKIQVKEISGPGRTLAPGAPGITAPNDAF